MWLSVATLLDNLNPSNGVAVILLNRYRQFLISINFVK